MIVVIGSPVWRPAGPSRAAGLAGRACGIALAAAAAGARVEIVGRVGEDAAGDALLFALSHGGVGHAAVIRDPSEPTPAETAGDLDDDDADEAASTMFAERPERGGRPAPAGLPLDAADVTLALRYLDPSGVVVVTDQARPAALAAAVDGGTFAGLQLVVLVAEAAVAPAGLPPEATILVVPDGDPREQGAFETLVGAYAAAIDSGASPAQAFAAASGGVGWEPVADAG